MCKTPETSEAACPSGGGPPEARTPRSHVIALALGIAGFTAVFTTLAVLRYRSFCAYDFTDLAGINQVIWRTVHAPSRPFFQTVTEQYFMGHIQPILLLLCIPYAIAPHVTTLFFLAALAAGLGAWPVYLLAKHMLSPRAGLVWAFAYLLYSPLHNVVLTDFRPVVFAIPTLLALLYAFERERFGWFCLWCVATLCVQESLGLWILFMGPYALWRRRSWKWAALPVVLGGAWFAVCTRLIMPLTFNNVIYPFGGYLYLWIGNESPGVLVRKILTNPFCYARLALSPSRSLLLFKSFWPLCFFSFAAPIAMIVPAATWFQLLMVHHSAIHATRIHWLAPLLPTFFFAAILGARRLAGEFERRGWAARRKALLAAPLVACALSNFGPNDLAQQSGVRPIDRPDLAYVTNLYDPAPYRMEPEGRVAWRALATIPADASVSASGDLMPALSHRMLVQEFGFELGYTNGRTRSDLDADYLAIHARSETFGAGIYNWPGIVRLRERVLRILDSGGWEPVFAEGNFLVLRRVDRADPARVAAAEAHVREAWSDAAAMRSPGGRMDLARTAYEAGRLDEAVTHYEAAAAMSPQDPFPRRKAGQILMQLGRPREALRWLIEAADRAPLCMATHLTLADTLAALRQHEAAEANYRAAIRLLPTDPQPYFGLGMVRLAQGDRSGAARAFRRALRLDPTFKEARAMLERCRER